LRLTCVVYRGGNLTKNRSEANTEFPAEEQIVALQVSNTFGCYQARYLTLMLSRTMVVKLTDSKEKIAISFE
jgi:hypothetical protein